MHTTFNTLRRLQHRLNNRSKVEKDQPVQESRVGRIFRQTDLKYTSWDARTADTKKFLKKSRLTGRHDDLKLLRYPYGYLEGLKNDEFDFDSLFKTT